MLGQTSAKRQVPLVGIDALTRLTREFLHNSKPTSVKTALSFVTDQIGDVK